MSMTVITNIGLVLLAVVLAQLAGRATDRGQQNRALAYGCGAILCIVGAFL